MIGAETTSLAGVTSTSGTTGETLLASGQQATQNGKRLETEVTEAIAALTTEVDTITSNLLTVVEAASTDTEAMEATGHSPAQARAAAAAFRADLNHVSELTHEAIQALGTRLIADATATSEAIGTQFAAIMTRFDTAVVGFGGEVNRFSTRLVDADQTSITYHA